VSLRDRWKYSRFRPKNTATHARYRNWLSTRYHARGNGKAPLPDRVTRGAASRTPVYRNRVNPATGRPRWTDRSDRALAKWQTSRPVTVRKQLDRGLARIDAETRAARQRGRSR
jgi:hypothetical protein